LLEVANDVALVVHPDSGDCIAMTARPQCSNLALDDEWMRGEAQIVIAAQFDVAGPRRAPLEGMATPPKHCFAADVVIINDIT